MSILAVDKKPVYDTSISEIKLVPAYPFSQYSFGRGDEIHFQYSSDDCYLYLRDSYIYVEGKVNRVKDDKTTKLVNNGILFLFKEIRLSSNGYVLDRVHNPGMTSLMKNYVSLTPAESARMRNSGWEDPGKSTAVVTADGQFNVCIRLDSIFGIAENHDAIIMNKKLELVMIRDISDNQALLGLATASVELTKVEWRMPFVTASGEAKLNLLKILDRDKALCIGYYAWQMFELSTLPQTTNYTWNVTTTEQLQKPRYVIVGLQTDRRAIGKDNSKFDHCNLRSVRLHLNDVTYPYHEYDLDFASDNYAALYEDYCKFQVSCFGRRSEPLLDRVDYKKHAPLFVFDCKRQLDGVKSGVVNVRLDLKSNENIPENTVVYCLIAHDKQQKYSPLTDTWEQII